MAKLEAKWQEREAEKTRRRENAAEASDPAENAHVFWQVRERLPVGQGSKRARSAQRGGRHAVLGPAGECLRLTVARGW